MALSAQIRVAFLDLALKDNSFRVIAMKTMNKQHEKDLLAAFSQVRNEDELRRFMIDLMTPSEIAAFAERWAIARLLDEGELSYREIASQTGGSTTTISRVARFLKQEQHQGYRLILDRLNKKKKS